MIKALPVITLFPWAFLGMSVSFFLGYPVRILVARIGMIDMPNARSSHLVPKARGGGLAIALACIAIGFVVSERSTSTIGMIFCATAIFVAGISFADDWRSISWGFRMGVHAACALLFVSVLLYFEVPIQRSIFEGTVLGFVLSLGMVSYSNIFNFLDGINGLAGFQAVVTGIGSIAIALKVGIGPEHLCLILAAIVVGAAAGFLPFNFPNPKIFMGDVGSVFLGFSLSAISIQIAMLGGWKLLIPLGLLHANFILDAGITLFRRIINGERLQEAHRQHFYQRLVDTGKTHAFVTVLEMLLQLIVMGLVIHGVNGNPALRISISVSVVGIWVIYFAWIETCYRTVRSK